MTSRPLGRVRTPRRPRQWGITSTNGTVASATPAGKLLIDLTIGLENELSVQMHNTTVSALRYNITYRQTAASVGDDDVIAMGIAWISNNALAAGPDAVPNPASDNFDWIFHDIRTVSATTATDLDNVARNGAWTIRNNSMRKQRENNSTLLMVTEVTLLQSASIQVFVGGRALFLLP